MATQTEIYQLYLAYFGRPPDFTGLNSFSNSTVAQVQAAFSASAESRALLASSDTATQVNNIYLNLFGRNAEPAGLAFWVGEIASGRVTLASAAFDILRGARNADSTTVANRIEVATAFVANYSASTAGILGYVGDAAAAQARTFLRTVTDTAASKTAALAGVAAAVTATSAAGAAAATTASGSTFTLTTGLDVRTGTAGNDNFDGSLSNGAQTLGSGDNLDGGTGTDSLFAVLAGSVTPARLNSIEDVRFTQTGANATLDLTNATGLQTVTSQGSSGANVTIANVASSVVVAVQDSAQDHTVTYSGVTGSADAATIRLTNSSGAITAAGIETLTLNAAGGTSTAAVTAAQATTVAITGAGALTLSGIAAATTVNGSAATGALSITTAAATAQTVTGGSANDTINGQGGADVLSGGAGNDQFVFGAGGDLAAVASVTGGDGTDLLRLSFNAVDTDLATPARFVGVEGVILDGARNVTLGANATAAGLTRVAVVSGTAADANTVDVTALGAGATIATGAGADTVNVNLDAGADSINTARSTGSDTDTDTVSITTSAAQVRVTFTSAEVGNGSVNDGATGTNQDGGLAVRLQRENTAGELTGDVSRADDEGIVFDATGTTTFDVRDLTSGAERGSFARVVLGTDAADTVTAIAATNGRGGYINAGAGNDLLGGNTGADFLVGGAGNDLIMLGTNTVAAAVAAADNNGNALAAITGVNATSGGNDSVIAGAGDDTVTVNGVERGGAAPNLINTARAGTGNYSIDGGDGNDTITSGTGNDTIVGGAGNDNITGGGGNDRITAGDGNDTVDVSGADGVVSIDAGAGDDRVVMGTRYGTTAATRDTVAGGDGIDTLVIAAAVAADDLGNTSGFERLEATHFSGQLNAALFGNLEQITVGGTGSDGTLDIINTASNFTQLNVTGLLAGANDAINARRLIDNSSNALTVNLAAGAATQTLAVGALDVRDEETLTIVSGNVAPTAPAAAAAAGTVTNTIASINAGDATSLVISGNQNLQTGTITATNLATVNASALTGATTTLNVDASTSTVALTFTGGTNEGATTVTTGTGNDIVNAGSGALTVSTGQGNDSVTGGAGADSVTGGTGNDTLRGGAGNDTLFGGGGVDSLVGDAGNDTFVFAEDAATGDTIVLGAAAETETIDVRLTANLAALNAGASLVGLDAVSLATASTVITATFASSQLSGLTVTVTGANNDDVLAVNLGAGGDVANLANVTLTTAASSITGGNGADIITGTAGVDTINGGAGADVITGGAGADVITGGAGADVITLTETTAARDTLIYAGGDTQVTIGGTGGTGTISGYDAVTAFNVGTTAAEKDLLDFAGTAGLAAAAAVNGTDSTLTIGAAAVKSHSVAASGVATFDDNDTFDAGSILVTNGQGALAAVVQYLIGTDIGDAGATLAFVIGGADGTQGSYVYSQVATTAGTTGGYQLVQLVGVTINALETTVSTTNNNVFIA